MHILIPVLIFSGWNIYFPVSGQVTGRRHGYKNPLEIGPTFVNDYADSPFSVFEDLDKGYNISDYDYAHFQEYATTRPLCDFMISEYNDRKSNEHGYIPSTCVPIQDCRTVWEKLGHWNNLTCEFYGFFDRGQYEPDTEFRCCPVQADQKLRPDLTLAPIYSVNEVPSEFVMYNRSYYTALTQWHADTVKNISILNRAFDGDYRRKFTNALVCGFRKGDIMLSASESPTGADVRSIIPFFCTEVRFCADQRTTSEDRKPHPDWAFFCANQVSFDSIHVGRDTCCHSDDIELGFFGEKVLTLPQLPLYFKYAPGLRSAYKCEEYSKLACDGTRDTCPSHGLTTSHFVALGFVRVKFMMFHCGGTLISRRYVISSAHCTAFYGLITNIALVGEVNTKDIKEENERPYIVSAILPYRTTGFSTLNGGVLPDKADDRVDIALFQTSRDVYFYYNVRPVCLFHTPIVPENTLQFAGFGPYYNDGYRTDRMKLIDLKFLEKQYCKDRLHYDEYEDYHYSQYGVNRDEMMCYHFPWDTSKSPCKYDRGGPLFSTSYTKPHCTFLLLGVLSSDRKNCSRYSPSVFINVTKYLAQIEDQVWGDYTFLDVFDKDLERKRCVPDEQLMFFNRDPS